nr:MAG TPA: hypothetical protein [Caudoviricetes sp.]DAH93326.1 MAG TPA: hypothetical protein [Caudoviricetes sp.]DAK86354.1 MAG TPA: hypothetical protein [Caudoviricetes sp.]DAN99732.1 MAG TPA: hypothetical protein [Caudoviricetes sp.]DAO93117.1 MAG TPA: hypothetical protein [Caudoviricetes sp.]
MHHLGNGSFSTSSAVARSNVASSLIPHPDPLPRLGI